MTQIAFHSQGDPRSLLSLSNTSRLLRDATIAARYEQVTFGWAIGVDEEGNIDEESLLHLQKVVREKLADLADNPSKLAAIRTLRVLEYSWYGEHEMRLLTKTVEGARGLEVLQMVTFAPAESRTELTAETGPER